MKNPGLDVFAADTFIKSRNHPLNIDPMEDDPFLEEGDNDSDYVPPVGFGRWRNPGQSLRVPVRVGPKFEPGETPEDVVHGEIISPEEQDGADKILHGDHESNSPSENPFVERAREDLHTPESSVAVETLTRLLKGAHPSTMSPEEMDAAHEYLSRHFTGVRANPRHGTVLAASPTGMQLVRRHQALPAIPDRAQEETAFSLTNKHGTFESDDPRRLVRAMVAFQIIHNEIAAQQRKKDKDDQDDNIGLTSTSGLFSKLRGGVGKAVDTIAEGLHQAVAPKPKTYPRMPRGAIFEPGAGTDVNDRGVRGGWVADGIDAPLNWHRDGTGVAYSPGHEMNAMLDPIKAATPRPDPYYPGHTFTYAPNYDTGHTIERIGGGSRYFATRLHPSVRGGHDIPPSPEQPEQPKTPKAAPVSALPAPPRRNKTPKPPPPASFPKKSAVAVNDLCPVCASGYLEPYDGEHHECLNCGSLVKEAARPKGGLGRGLKQIQEYEGDPLNLASGGSENPENVDPDAPEEGYVHPLAGQENQNPDEVYQAPKRILDKGSSIHLAMDDDEAIDKHLTGLGFTLISQPNNERAYLAQMPGTSGGYVRLTEGVGGHGWVLTADHVPSREQYTQNGQPYRRRDMAFDQISTGPDARPVRQYLTDPGERTMAAKSILATGHHPIEDDSLNRAIRDVVQHGRNSQTYQKVLDTAYEPKRPPVPGPGKTQRDLRGLSSVANPGLTRFVN